jgi:uncharacterized coiled-coil protein SlyX
MMVFDIAAPVNGDLPIATIATGSLPFSVAVSGNYACVVHVGSDNMMVFDISNPNAPSLSATIATGTNPISVAISGNYGYVVNQSSNNMMVFNISNPGAPILSATIAAGSQPFSVAVSGNYAYVVHIGSDNMMVFDISNPNAPSLSATIATGSFPGSVAISGNHAYVTNTNSNNMMVFELFCPQAIGIDASGQFVIQDPTWASAGADIVNANTGNVGIGWASPTSRFAVQTGTDTQGSRLLFDDLGISIVDRFFGNDFAAKIWGEWPGDGRLHFGVNSNGGAASVVPTMTIRNVGGTGTVGNVGIGTTAPTATLSVNGTANKPGGGSWAVFSDRRLKKDIRLYADGLNSVLAINPVKFKYNGISVADTTTEYIGVIAQELEEVSPYMINTIDIEGTEYLEVDNSAMTYMLINAVKELNAMIEEQQERIAELEATIGKQDLDNTVLRSELAQQRKLIEANANLLKDLTSALNAQSSK